MRDVVDECLAVASLPGSSVPGDTREAVRRIARTMPGQYSSTAQDLARGQAKRDRSPERLVVREGERSAWRRR